MKHIRYECDKPHMSEYEPQCPYCDGGLFTCTTCGASEGELTTDCPGVTMTEEQRKDRMAGVVDFVNGMWTRPNLKSVNT